MSLLKLLNHWRMTIIFSNFMKSSHCEKTENNLVYKVFTRLVSYLSMRSKKIQLLFDGAQKNQFYFMKHDIENVS